MRRALALAYFLAALTLTPEVSAQQICEAPNRCRSKAQILQLVDAKCGERKQKAAEFDGLRLKLDEANAGWEQCRGAGLTLEHDRDALRLDRDALRLRVSELEDRWSFGTGAVVGFVVGVIVAGVGAFYFAF